MNVLLYHGSNESRETIREFEFYYTDASGAPAGGASAGNGAPTCKFHTLITSYEVIKQDLLVLRRIPWRYMVVDEAHRLKNKDSALANDLRTLQARCDHAAATMLLQRAAPATLHAPCCAAACSAPCAACAIRCAARLEKT
jgi:SNF2 family DNA or RNA helicase